MPNHTYLCLASGACLRVGMASMASISYTLHSLHICQWAIVKNLPADPFRRPRCSLKSGHKGLARLGSASAHSKATLVGDHLRPPFGGRLGDCEPSLQAGKAARGW